MNVLNKYAKRLVPVIVAFAFVTSVTSPASAAQITSLSVNPGDSRISVSSTHVVTLTASTTAIACVKITYSINADGTGGNPVTIGAGANTPAGSFLAAGYTGATVGGAISWSKATASAPVTNTAGTLSVAAITNPGTIGSRYVTVETFSNQACTTSVDKGVAAFVVTEGTVVSAVVDPTMTFTVADNAGTSCNGVNHSGDSSASANTVNLGRVNTGSLKFDSQNVTVSTNGVGGYTVFARYGGSMTDGTNTITNFASANSAPTVFSAAGVEAFGYTTDDVTLSGTANRFSGSKFAGMTTTNGEVAYAAAGPVSNATNCVGYQIGVNGTTPAGNYSTTVTYTAVPVF